jgi:hypothetical protein
MCRVNRLVAKSSRTIPKRLRNHREHTRDARERVRRLAPAVWRSALSE